MKSQRVPETKELLMVRSHFFMIKSAILPSFNIKLHRKLPHICKRNTRFTRSFSGTNLNFHMVRSHGIHRFSLVDIHFFHGESIMFHGRAWGLVVAESSPELVMTSYNRWTLWRKPRAGVALILGNFAVIYLIYIYIMIRYRHI